MVDIINCGYIRVELRKLKSDKLTNKVIFAKLEEHFGSNVFTIDEDTFEKRINVIYDGFTRWGTLKKRDERDKYITTFSSENWEKLSPSEQRRHRVSKCYQCSFCYSEQDTFPFKTNDADLIALSSRHKTLQVILEQICKYFKTNGVNKGTAAQLLHHTINNIFEKVNNISLVDALGKRLVTKYVNNVNKENETPKLSKSLREKRLREYKLETQAMTKPNELRSLL